MLLINDQKKLIISYIFGMVLFNKKFIFNNKYLNCLNNSINNLTELNRNLSSFYNKLDLINHIRCHGSVKKVSF